MRKFTTQLAAIIVLGATTLSLSACTSGTNGDGCAAGATASCSASPTPKSTKGAIPPPPVATLPPRLSAARQAAQNRQVASDLTRAKKALSAYAKANGGNLPQALDAKDLGRYGFKLSAKTFISAYQTGKVGSASVYCITGGSAGGTLYTVTSTTPVKVGGLCPSSKAKW